MDILKQIREYRTGHAEATHEQVALALGTSKKTVQRKLKAMERDTLNHERHEPPTLTIVR